MIGWFFLTIGTKHGYHWTGTEKTTATCLTSSGLTITKLGVTAVSGYQGTMCLKGIRGPNEESYLMLGQLNFK